MIREDKKYVRHCWVSPEMQESPSTVRRFHSLGSVRLMPGVDLPNARMRKLSAALHVILTDSDETPDVRSTCKRNMPSQPILTSPPLRKSKARRLCAGNQHSRLVCSETKRREPDADNRSLIGKGHVKRSRENREGSRHQILSDLVHRSVRHAALQARAGRAHVVRFAGMLHQAAGND